MNLLLDTHTFLWWVAGDEQLSVQAKRAIGDPQNTVRFSAASAWEIAIKASLGRLDVPRDLTRFLAEQLWLNDFVELPVHVSHAAFVQSLPRHHRDPFDRMLVAQAHLDDLVLVTRDPAFEAYDVTALW